MSRGTPTTTMMVGWLQSPQEAQLPVWITGECIRVHEDTAAGANLSAGALHLPLFYLSTSRLRTEDGHFCQRRRRIIA